MTVLFQNPAVFKNIPQRASSEPNRAADLYPLLAAFRLVLHCLQFRSLPVDLSGIASLGGTPRHRNVVSSAATGYSVVKVPGVLSCR